MTGRPRLLPASRRWRAGVLLSGAALLAVIALLPGIQPPASGDSAASLAGSQGIVAPLPATSSAVTVSGQGTYSGLKVTVNQTANLVNQAISVSWTGSAPTAQTSTDTDFEQNYLQIFQCWGSSDPSDPPPPSQCEFGAESTTPTSSYPISTSGFEYTRVLAPTNWSDYGQVGGCVDPSTGWDMEPFVAVDGTTICQEDNGDYLANGEAFWRNQYFSFNTTNEIDFARTYPSASGQGEGNVLFQVDTGEEAPGLGCGQSSEPVVGGGTTVPGCWLVIVPRGTPQEENPPGLNASSVETSPLTPQAWQNRIAIPLQFQPVGNSCTLNSNTERIDGGELAAEAVDSWEDTLCASPGSPSFDYTLGSDDLDRENITQPTYGAAGMSAFSDPIEPSETNPSDPVVYAPLTLSAVVVAFNIDRVPVVNSSTGYEPQQDEVPIQGTQVAHIYLTPRLVAKLLTESYPDELQDVSSTTPGYSWTLHNPLDLFTDPDFLQYNPEFSLLTSLQGVDSSSLIVEETNSDAASLLWQWVLSDPSARAWLDGQPDPWGMRVNPYYSTNPAINPSGTAFGDPVPDNYPKSDPYCLDTGDEVGTPPQPVPPLCVQDWSPYVGHMHDAAVAVATADDGAKTELNPQGTIEDPWSANGPQETGTYFIMSVTDSASAAQYGLQTASLSRDGDDGSDPVFVAPTEQGILGGEQAMVQSDVPGVLQANPATTAADAYPLSMLTYAATTPDSLDGAERQAYSSFLEYAAGAGQVQGSSPGQLPAGYVPLPSGLQAQTRAAAATVLNPPAQSTGTSAPVKVAAAQVPTVVPTPAAVCPAVVSIVTPNNLAATARTADVRVGSLRWAVPMVLAAGVGLLGVAVAVDASGRYRRRPRRHQPDDRGAGDVDPPKEVFAPW